MSGSGKLSIAHWRSSPNRLIHWWRWAVALIVIGALSWAVTGTTQAAQQSSSGQISINGQVAGQPPATAPTFSAPANNSQFQANTVTLSGECTAQLIVKIFRNGDFAGSAFCGDDNTFQLAIELVPGQNQVVARQYDGLDQAGPASAPLTLYLVSSAPPTSAAGRTGTSNTSPGSQTTTTVSQLRIIVPGTIMSGYVNHAIATTVLITGGAPPYALSAQWGDGQELLLSRTGEDQFSVAHVYTKAGDYQLLLKASDSQQQSAQVEVAVRIGGPVVGGGRTTPGARSFSWWRQQLSHWWPLPVAALLCVAAAALWYRHRRRRLLPSVPNVA